MHGVYSIMSIFEYRTLCGTKHCQHMTNINIISMVTAYFIFNVSLLPLFLFFCDLWLYQFSCHSFSCCKIWILNWKRSNKQDWLQPLYWSLLQCASMIYNSPFHPHSPFSSSSKNARWLGYLGTRQIIIGHESIFATLSFLFLHRQRGFKVGGKMQ